MGYVPAGVEALVCTVNAEAPPAATEPADHLADAPGMLVTPVAPKLTVPLKPAATTSAPNDVDCPGFTVLDAWLRISQKSAESGVIWQAAGAGGTVTGAAECL